MDEVIGFIFAGWILVVTITSIIFWTTDYRDFDKVVKACQTTGYIQDTKTRIICAPERPIDRN